MRRSTGFAFRVSMIVYANTAYGSTTPAIPIPPGVSPGTVSMMFPPLSGNSMA